MKSCILSLLCLVLVCFSSSHLKANLKEKNQIHTYLSADTVRLKVKNLDCPDFDTIRLVGTGHKFKKKQYYYTDKECTVVELNKKKNTNRFGWNTVLKFLEKVIMRL